MINPFAAYRTREPLGDHDADLHALDHSDVMYRTIVETAREGVWIWDTDGRTVFTNQRMADMLGYTPEEMLGTPVFAYMEGDDDRAIAKQEIGESREGQREFKYRRKDGSRLSAILEISAMSWEDGSSEGLCAMVTDISQRKAREDEVSRQSLHDPLTGLANRVLLGDRLEHALRRCEREDTAAAVLFLDLDGFKDVNDTYGHTTGDALLVAVAERLRTAVRSPDTVARTGGDEFVIVSESLRDAGDACVSAERLCVRIGEPFDINGQQIAVGISIGIAFGRGRDQADVVLRNADLAMYQAKAKGGGQVHLFEQELRARLEHRRRMQGELDHAIGREELSVVYQPVVSLDDERTIGAESLIRWHHPEEGLLHPSAFIPLAEESGLIGALDEWVLEQACRQLETWHRAGLGQLTLAVNLSAQEFGDPHLIDRFARTIRATGADPRRLVVEITESTLMSDFATSAVSLIGLRATGVTVAIDDYGTGCSSLAYLKELAVDMLKIDGSFVCGLGKSDEDASIVAAIIAMARALGLTTVAEGVETAKQLMSLRALGCNFAQGYLWAGALHPDELTHRALEESGMHTCDAPRQAPNTARYERLVGSAEG